MSTKMNVRFVLKEDVQRLYFRKNLFAKIKIEIGICTMLESAHYGEIMLDYSKIRSQGHSGN